MTAATTTEDGEWIDRETGNGPEFITHDEIVRMIEADLPRFLAYCRYCGAGEAPGTDPEAHSAACKRPRVVVRKPDTEPAWVTAYNAEHTWDELLTGDGWTLHHVDSDGEQHWTRPGKNPRKGSSATVGYNGTDKLRVFSGPDWLPVEDSYSRWAYMVHRDFDGDFRAASRAMRDGAR